MAGTSSTSSSSARIQTKVVPYEYEGTTLKGYLAHEDALQEKRPGVLVVHEWWGLNDYARMRAEMLAKLGYVAFAVDMYGEGKTTENPQEAGQWMTSLQQNVPLWQGRISAGLKALQTQEMVDPSKIAVIGYCFGGATALQLSYTGAKVAAVVTFHAALPTPTEEQAKAIQGHVLICHGAADPFIPPEAIAAFESAMTQGGARYQIIQYPEAVHSFTVQGVDRRGIQGLSYNAEADQKSWEAMLSLFQKVFA